MNNSKRLHLSWTFFLLLANPLAYAQERIDQRPPNVDELFLATTFIEMFSADTKVRTATGFFYQNNRRQVFLLTNRHVVVEEKESFFPDRLRLRLHTDPSDLRLSKTVDLALYDDDKKTRKRWKEIDPTVDVVSIEIESTILHDFHVKPLSERNVLPAGTRIGLAEPLVALGYPAGFFDEIHNLPVARQGAVASAYPVPFRGESFFLVDAILHAGLSGSPVFTRPRPGSTSMTISGELTIGQPAPAYLIGINSGYYGNLNLNIVWYSDVIRRLVE